MYSKFYNYLYDYMIREGFICGSNPRDQKDKKRYVVEYIEKFNRFYRNSRLSKKELLKSMYFEKYVIKYEDIPESYFKHQELMDFNRGFGYEVLTNDERLNHAEMIINDQRKSLENLIDYFFSNAMKDYSDELKFWAFQGIIKLSKYNKETGEFGRRTKGTIFPFVELNKEALILTIDAMDRFLKNEEVDNLEMFKLFFYNNGGLNTSFTKLYTYFFNFVNNKKAINSYTQGIWVKYAQGSDYTKLVSTLEGKGTGWCTVISSTAERHLRKGDFYVYYTVGEDGEYTEPRIAIRMRGNDTIGEISGIDKNQEVELELTEVLNNKLEDFSDKDRYLKKVHDMKKMTLIYSKFQNNIDLSIEELRFLYEIDCEIKGFGGRKDPRIREIIDARDIKSDLSKVLNCSKEEIGVSPEPLGNTLFKYYYGDLNLYCYEVPNLVLPKVISGNLSFLYLMSVDGIVLPESVGKNLYFHNLRYVDSLTVTCNVHGSVYLNNLRYAKEVIFLENIGGGVRLENLENINDLIFYQNLRSSLHLDSLKKVNNLIFYGNVGGMIYLSGLKSINGKILLKNVKGNIYLDSLTNVEGLIVLENSDYDKIEAPYLDKKRLLVKKN